MTWKRAQRLEALIKEKVATVVVEHLADPALGFVTVLRCELSDDKRIAKVFYTVLGEPTVQRRTVRAIERAAPHIQERIAPSLKVRFMPKLRFVLDDSLEKEAHIQKLIDRVASEWSDAPRDPLDEPPADDVPPSKLPTPRRRGAKSTGDDPYDDDADPFDDDELDG